MKFLKPKIEQYISTGDIYTIADELTILRELCKLNVTPNEYITSPLRQDNNPGTWWQYLDDGHLYFRDFAHEIRPINVVEFVQRYLDLESYEEAKRYIWNYFVKNYKLSEQVAPKKKYEWNRKYIRKGASKIRYNRREWLKKDIEFWYKYTNTPIELIKEDDVKAIKKNFKKEGKDNWINGYQYFEFYPRFKLYFPGHNPKFLSKTNRDDIGNWKKLPKEGDHLIITKSYKDARLLRTMVTPNVAWFQSENTFPTELTLKALAIKFDKIFIFFDNDDTGIINSFKLHDAFTDLGVRLNRLNIIFVPDDNYKDASDFFVENTEQALEWFWKLKQKL